MTLSTPSSAAATEVPARSAAAGLIPWPASRANSSAFRPWGLTPESVPNAIFTPMRMAWRRAAPWASAAALALTAISGG